MNKKSTLKSDSISPRIQGNFCKAWSVYTSQQLEELLWRDLQGEVLTLSRTDVVALPCSHLT